MPLKLWSLLIKGMISIGAKKFLLTSLFLWRDKCEVKKNIFREAEV
jgi:hypothetical protein